VVGQSGFHEKGQDGKRADYGDKSDGLLEGAGKAIRYVKIGSETDLKKQLFTSWIKQTANANR